MRFLKPGRKDSKVVARSGRTQIQVKVEFYNCRFEEVVPGFELIFAELWRF